MEIKKLDHSFYDENKHLQEALDLIDQKWTANKQRGHGFVRIKVNSLLFAIPLRSHIRHKAACFSDPHDKKGLDFSKALLIKKESYISSEIFKINNEEFLSLARKERTLEKRFSKYVNRYITACVKSNKHILCSPEYKYTTLSNYHSELNIP